MKRRPPRNKVVKSASAFPRLVEADGEFSISQPRDNNPKAAYVVYDMEETTIELRRLDYDIPKAQKKILDAGLPPRLAERLALGR